MELTELNEVLKQISEHVTRLEQLREESPEVREALSLMHQQEQLVKRLQEGCKEQMLQPVPYPYPVYPYPVPMWQPTVITTTTTANTKHITDQVVRQLGNKLRAQMGTI